MAQGAPIGNEFWKLRLDMSKDGRKLSIEDFIKKSQEYIDYCINEPLKEVDFVGKDATKVEKPKMRAMTVQGLCHWLGITVVTLQEWAKDEKYSNIITRVKQIMYAYKFEGAAAGMLNPNIIARDLGLADKSITENKGLVKELVIQKASEVKENSNTENED